MVDLDIVHLAEVMKNIAGEHESAADSGVEGGNHALDGPCDGDRDRFDGVVACGSGPFLVVRGEQTLETGDNVSVHRLLDGLGDSIACSHSTKREKERVKNYTIDKYTRSYRE